MSFPSDYVLNMPNNIINFQSSEIEQLSTNNILFEDTENNYSDSFEISKVKGFVDTINNETIDIINDDIYFIKQKNKDKFIISKSIYIPPLLNLVTIFNFMLEHIKIDNKIKKILNINCYTNNIILEKIMGQLIIKEDRRYKRLDNNTKDNSDNFLKKKIGRKRKDDISMPIHDKYAPDNIINKIKNILKKYLIIFVNNIINNLYDRDKIIFILTTLHLPINSNSRTIIKDIEHKSLSNIKKKDENLNLLNYNLRELLSFNLSERNKTIYKKEEDFSDYNKKIIKYLLEEDNYKVVFTFIFKELTLENWLDIFIYKIELNDFPTFKSLAHNIKGIIINSLVRIEDFFEELNNQKDIYFVSFLLLIYNYKRYYMIKRGRKARKNREKSKDKEK